MKQELDYINTLEANDFLEWIESVDVHFQNRIAMLQTANKIFNSHRALSELNEIERGLFLSKSKEREDDHEFDVNLFGSAGGSGHVKSIISSKYPYFDEFFAAIPRKGKVTEDTYFKLVELFKLAIQAAGIRITPFVLFSRILTITRPDTFVSGAAGKLELFNKALGKRKLNNDFDRYWQETLPALHQLKPFMNLVGDPLNYNLALMDGVKSGDFKNENKVNEVYQPMNQSKSPLNEILYGPPGTGKTYHTIEAAVMAAEPSFSWISRDELKAEYNRLVNEKRIRFVTFHQSYGYEEFVEGLKARETESGGVTYATESGIFKNIARQAEADGDLCQEKLSLAIDKMKDEILGGRLNLETITNKPFTVTYREGGTFRVYPKGSVKEDLANGYSASFKDIDAYYKGHTKVHNPSYVRAILQYLVKQYNLPDAQDNPTESADKVKNNYVLVIDEINRGNISKIFGELITLIEPSKRQGESEALEVVLAQSGEVFSVPNNLHIIGTMNTADRSLAMMDTALRRRFDFKEMQPNPALFDDEFGIIEGVNLTLLLSALNKRIEALYDREHTLGHAFLFPAYNAMKAGDATKAMTELRSAFQNKIIPLLEEYFYEDWSKIRLVLADNQKSDEQPEKQFIRKSPIEYADLFGNAYQADEYGQPESSYALAPFDDAVWKSTEAYQSIYRSLIKTAE